MLSLTAAAAFCALTSFPVSAQTPDDDALLVIAHGARAEGWNERVIQMMEKVDWAGPKGVAFLTPRTPNQDLVKVAERLDKAGAKRIVIVPLLVSSFSDHYEEIRYYGRDRKDAPDHFTHEPLATRAQIVVTPAMDSDRLLGRILADQIHSVSKDPKNESVMLVAHGPNDDADNEKWLACLKVQAAYLQWARGFRRVDAATIRDDAPKPVKDAAVAVLRERVKSYGADSKVLIQPVLISTGHVQAEIAALLKGMDFTMSTSGVAAHSLTPEWIRQQAVTALRTRTIAQNSPK
jgi:sirohydrochlorin cobaltochelatase